MSAYKVLSMKTRSGIRHGLLLTFALFLIVFCQVIYLNQSVFEAQSTKLIYDFQETLNVKIRHQNEGMKWLLQLI